MKKILIDTTIINFNYNTLLNIMKMVNLFLLKFKWHSLNNNCIFTIQQLKWNKHVNIQACIYDVDNKNDKITEVIKI